MANVLQADPTRTRSLRKRLIAELTRRLVVISNQLQNQFTPISRASIERIIAGARKKWMKIIDEALRKGVSRGFVDTKRSKLLPEEASDVLKDDFMEGMKPAIAVLLAVLGARIFNELLGLSQEVSTRTNRVFMDSEAQGLSNAEILRRIRREIEVARNRAARIARTEIIRAHAQGQLASFEELKVERLKVLVEWKTSGLGFTALGNPSPCPLCKPLEGVVFTIREAAGLIPRHPNCLCSFSPVVEKKKVGQRRKVQRAIRKSVRAETGERTITAGREESTWAGADRTISRRRTRRR